MSFRIALTADWHFRGKDLGAAVSQLEALIAAAHEHHCTAVCVAGDIFDRENVADARANVAAIAAPLVRLVRTSGLEWTIIPGNHDFSGPKRTPATELLRGAQVDLVNVPNTVGIFYGGATPVRAVCLPWEYSNRNPEEVIAQLVAKARAEQSPGTKLLLLGHVQVVGGKLNALRSHEAHGGWEISREFLEGLDVDHIALGDFHARQDLSNGRGGYIGALRQLNHGESGNPAGFEVWDPATGETEWVELDAAPTYHTVEAFGNEDLERIEAQPNAVVRVICHGFTPERTNVDALEATGFEVVHAVAAIERIQRAVEIPEGILRRPADLIPLYNRSLASPLPPERIDALRGLYLRAKSGAPLTKPACAPAPSTSARVDAQQAAARLTPEEAAAAPWSDVDMFSGVAQ